MTDQLNSLMQAAGEAANSGRWHDAEQLWRDVQRLDPHNPKAHFSLGVHAFQRRDLAGALAHLTAARQVSPNDPQILLTLAIVQRERGDTAGEWEAINGALAADAYFLPGLLAKAGLQERFDRPRAAAATYRNALKVAPPPPHWPPELRPQLAHARALVDADTAAFTDFLDERMELARARLEPGDASRWREAASIMSGRSQPYHSVANQLHVPRLPAIPFLDPSLFPWVAAIETQTAAIRGEIEAVLADDGQSLSPYIAYRPGEPVNQWAELNHSTRWGVYQLWQGGEGVQPHLSRCPVTAKALDLVEMAQIGGLCPNAMFSALGPHTQIPPHHGETNARLVAHLPLVVPPNCTYRVGFEERRWEVGKVLIFDDTLEHTARNDSDDVRIVLIFDVWNPLLTNAERNLVNVMTAAARDFHLDP